MEKTCFKCGETKPLDEFYGHPKMADGHLGKCKACTKSDVQSNYRIRKPKYQAYYRDRELRPDRKAHKAEAQRRSRSLSPEKYKARCAISNAIRDGKLVRKPCEVCGSQESQAHHEDYSKPLDVRWLCFKHHRIAHGQYFDELVTAV